MILKKSNSFQNTFQELIYGENDNMDDFPVLIAETAGIDKSSNILHYHQPIEICGIKQGTGNLIINGKVYSFKAGDIFIIGSNEVHLAYNDRDVIIQVILFKPSLLWNGSGYTFEMESLQNFDEFTKKMQHKILPADRSYAELKGILNQIFEEYQRRKVDYKLMLQSLFLQFSALLARYFDLREGLKNGSRLKKYDSLLPVIEYIKINYGNKIKIVDLAAIVNMSVSNLNIVFKRDLGVTPIAYINKIRIIKATQFLLETDMKIIDVAANCGFFSLPHFIHSFKKYTGKLPKNFRNI